MKPGNERPVDRTAGLAIAAGEPPPPRRLADGESEMPLSFISTPPVRPDLKGEVFDRLTVIGFDRYGSGNGTGTTRTALWVCRCSCGVYCRRRERGLLKRTAVPKMCSSCQRERNIRRRTYGL